MFLQNLWKKLNDFVSPLFKNVDRKKIEEFVEESYTDILKALAIIGGVIILIIALITFVVARNSKPLEKKAPVVTEKVEERIKPDTSLLLSDEYMYPDIETFEIKTEYQNFMMIKKYKIPDFNSINYDIMMDDAIEETCKFDFEKRR